MPSGVELAYQYAAIDIGSGEEDLFENAYPWVYNIPFCNPTLEQWSAFLARSDDPLIFEQDETGHVKTVHRKVQYAISGAVQWEIFARDDFRCMYCGKRPPEVSLTIDHFWPLELGGPNQRNNYASSCRRCNKQKGSTDPQVYCEDNGLDYDGLSLYLYGNAPASFIAHLT